MRQGTVTAVIPAYNPGGHLTRSLASVLAQVGVDLDVVVVDDGSSEDLTSTPGLTDPRVRYVKTANRGVSAARNLGVAMSDAEYVAFLDQDDEWVATDKLRRQIHTHQEQPDASFVHTGFQWILPNERYDASTPTPVTYQSNLEGTGYVCLSTMLIRRDLYITVGGHDLELAQQQDWDLTLKLLRSFGPAPAVNGPLVHYYVHGANASRNYSRAAAEAHYVLNKHLTPETLPIVRTGRRRAGQLYASKAIDAARSSYRARNFRSSAAHLAVAGKLDPQSLPQAAWRTIDRRLRRH